MIRNYFKTAYRSLQRQRQTTAINLLGLSLGMAAAFYIFIWVGNEKSFDRYHPEAGRIYRLTSLYKTADSYSNTTPYFLGELAESRLPMVENYTRMRPETAKAPSIKLETEVISEKKATYVDENWFSFFHYQVLSGTVEGFGKDPLTVVLTQEAAIKYFGQTEDIIGKELEVNGKVFTVRALIEDAPLNSSFQYAMYIPVSARHLDPFWKDRDLRPDMNMYQTYIKLRADADPDALKAALHGLLPENWHHTYDLSLRPLTGLHFEEGLEFSDIRHGNLQLTNILFSLGILILLVAAFNYINLVTARITTRIKEISVKKIIGADSIQLFIQFVFEAVLTCFFALLLAVLLAWLFMPLFNQITGQHFPFALSDPALWKTFGLTALICVMLTSIYPAWRLSSLVPVTSLRHGRSGNSGPLDNSIRKTLVVLQFACSFALVAGSAVVYAQMQFIQQQYERLDYQETFSFLMPIGKADAPNEKRMRFEQVKAALLSHSSIQHAGTYGGSDLVYINNPYGGFDWEGKAPDEQASITFISPGSDLRQFMGYELVEGRWFLPDHAGDNNNYMINETAIKALGLAEPVIGKRFSLDADTGHIIGVVRDFPYASLKEAIGPVVIGNHPFYMNAMMVRAAPGKKAMALEAAKQVFKKYLPAEPFVPNHMDEELAYLYRHEFQLGRLIGVFSALAVLISCIGLYGIASFAAARRRREIGIRKVLGASTGLLSRMLSLDFLHLVFIAILCAAPLVWWAMDRWLAYFAYRIHTTVWYLLLPAGILTVIALLTISWQAIRAAMANPVDSLKEE